MERDVVLAVLGCGTVEVRCLPGDVVIGGLFANGPNLYTSEVAAIRTVESRRRLGYDIASTSLEAACAADSSIGGQHTKR